MASFKELQSAYLTAKQNFEEASRERYTVRQQLLVTEKQIDQYLKAALLASIPVSDPLSMQRAELITRQIAADAKNAAAQAALTAARLNFETQGAANKTMVNLDNSIPILLLPLKIQTRYRTLKHFARNIPQQLMVDVSTLNPITAQNIRMIFPGAVPEHAPSAAFQAFSLSSSYQPVAKQIIASLNQVVPPPNNRWQKVEDIDELWIRIFPDDIFLQSHEPALTAEEFAAGKKFWQLMWDAERAFRKSQPADQNAEPTKKELQLSAWKALRLECLHHRAAWIARVLRPAEFPDNLSIDTEIIPAEMFPAIQLKSESWTMPPYTETMPDQFIVRLYLQNQTSYKEIVGARIPEFLQLGFNPDEPAENNDNLFAERDHVLELPPSIKWLTDLKAAEECGMAVKYSFGVNEPRSISKIVVMGIKTSMDAPTSSNKLAKLFENHHYKNDGMSFLSQGTPTNNIPGHPAGFNKDGLTDEESFRLEYNTVSQPDDPLSDGQQLSTLLGLETKAFTSISNNDNHEGAQAKAINQGLWSATMGYYLDNLMRPTVGDADIAHVKNFFQNFVTGRGLLPSLRLGKQPYGIIPATVWSDWKVPATASKEETRMVRLLKKLNLQWEKLIPGVKTMKSVFANTANEEAVKRDFREILTYQASSTRYFRRLVAGEYLLFNINKTAMPLSTDKSGILTTPAEFKARMEAPTAWGEVVAPRPRMMGKFLDDENYKLTDLPVSDITLPLPATFAGKNYLPILLSLTFEQLKTGAPGDDFAKYFNERPHLLMFSIARFALLQGWVDAATKMLQAEQPKISPFARLDFEWEYIINNQTFPSHEHTTLLTASGLPADVETRKNKWAFFEQKLADGTRVDEKIAQKLGLELPANDPVKPLQDARKALASLSDLPVEKLERLFSEHLDLCSFRLDAWLQGLSLSRLYANRKKPGYEKGVFIGAYGYVENLAANTERWTEAVEIATPVVVDANLVTVDKIVAPVVDFTGYSKEAIDAIRTRILVYLGSDPAASLAEDPQTKKIIQNPSPGVVNGNGYILTPSIEHAATAGILRAGYEHHSLSQGTQSKTLAVNIDSERAGIAMDMLKGVQAGHSLNEQLGYFIERAMYGNLALAQYIPSLRLAFPLRVELNEWDNDQNIAEANKTVNTALVADGLAILNKNQDPFKPPAWTDKLKEVFKVDEVAKVEFTKIINIAKDQFDAVSDLVIAESVFQMVKGSPERASAAMRMVNEGSDITLPEIVKIPSDSRVFTHRIGVVLNHSASTEKAWPSEQVVTSLYARFLPDLNKWLGDQLPSPEKIFAVFTSGVNAPVKISLRSLGLQPIDLYHLVHKSGTRLQESLLTWLVKEAGRKLIPTVAGEQEEVSFNRSEGFAANEFALNEVLPLLSSIVSLLEKSRSMKPIDFQVTAGATPPANPEDYDNSLLKSVCVEIATSQANGPINSFIDYLTVARKELELNFPSGFISPESQAAFYKLYHSIPLAFNFGIWDALPNCSEMCNPATARLLLEHADQVVETLRGRIVQAVAAINDLELQPLELEGEKVFEKLSGIVRIFCGEDVLILARFRLSNAAEVMTTFNDTVLASSIVEFGIEEWLQSLAMIRENTRNYLTVTNIRETFNSVGANRRLKILQLPYLAGVANSWIGGKLPPGFEPPANVCSMAYEFASDLVPGQVIAGFVTDDWREKVPLKDLTAGVSINYNQANSEAPQSMLLVVSPNPEPAGWDFESVVNSILETMTLAKKRAVDTEIIQQSWMSQFLPALVMPLDVKNNTPNLDFRIAGPSLVNYTKPKIDTGGLGNIGFMKIEP